MDADVVPTPHPAGAGDAKSPHAVVVAALVLVLACGDEGAVEQSAGDPTLGCSSDEDCEFDGAQFECLRVIFAGSCPRVDQPGNVCVEGAPPPGIRSGSRLCFVVER